LAVLRRRVEERLAVKDVKLILDEHARLERDRRRA
jgi:hypothetical protein